MILLLKRVISELRIFLKKIQVVQWFNSHLQGLILHISARSIRLLETAEDMEIRKRDQHNALRHFTINELEDFIPHSGALEDFLTSTEKQSIVKHELDNLRAMSDETHVPGYPQLKLYEGQSLGNFTIQYPC